MERFLQGKYPDIADKLETKAVKKSVEETEDEEETKEEKEEAYLERIERIAKTKRGSEILHHRYFKESLTDTSDGALIEKLALNLFESEKYQAINEGHGADLPEELSEDMLEKYKETILRRLESQKESLERIVNYIDINEDGHPLWYRYFMLRSIQGMGTYDAESNSYLGRTEETVAPFIHLNHEAVGFVRTVLEQKYDIKDFLDNQTITTLSNAEQKRLNIFEYRLRKGDMLTDEEQVKHAELKERYQNHKAEKKEKSTFQKEEEDAIINGLHILYETDEEKERVQKLFKERLQSESFSQLYAFARKEVYADIQYVTDQGVWKHFPQGGDANALEDILKGKGTGWCTASGSAPEHLKGGDFYVYQTYTKEEFDLLESGEDIVPTQPAIAVRMLNGEVYEVRGTEPDQGLTPIFNDVAMEQVRKLPGGENWEKRSADMKLLTKLSKKQEDNEPFTKEELRFLYEFDADIEGFGYDIDPRINVLKEGREKEQDITTIFNAEGKTARSEDYPWPSDTKVLFGELKLSKKMELPESLEYIDESVKIIGDGLSSEIADSLIKIKQGYVVVENLGMFIVDHNEIVNDLIEAGQANVIDYHLGRFFGLTPDTINRIIEAGCGHAVAEYLEKFTGLDHVEIANKLIENHQGPSVAYCLNKFKGVSHVEIANRLIEVGAGSAVADNIKKFTGLDHVEIANRIIESGEGEGVAVNLEKFTGLDHVEIANRLIEAGEVNSLTYSLQKFTGLDHADTANRIIDMGEVNYLVVFLDKFSGLTAEIARKLIDLEYTLEVARNKESFAMSEEEWEGLFK